MNHFEKMTRPTIHLRPAARADIPRLVDIASTAFLHDPIYMQFSPHHFTYPADYRAFLLAEMKRRIVSPGQVIMVAETESMGKLDDGFSGKELEIAGYAVWIRSGTPKEVAMWRSDNIWMRYERMLLSLEENYRGLFDRTSRTAVKRLFHGQAKEIVQSQKFPSYLDLNTLAVSPSHQRIGIGGKLLDWGMEKAREEKVPVLLEATMTGKGLYLKRGFKELGNTRLEGRDDVDARTGGVVRAEEVVMPVMAWRPES